MIYQLMHKDEACGELTEMSGVIQSYQDNGEEFSPFFGNCDFNKIKKRSNAQSYFDMYIDICVHAGVDCQIMQDFMDYMILTDFIISNTDEHLQNFGILRNPYTMKSFKALKNNVP